VSFVISAMPSAKAVAPMTAITLWELAWLGTHDRLKITGTVEAFFSVSVGFYQREISAMMTFLGLGFGVSIFVLSALAHFVPLRHLWKVRTNIDALKKYLVGPTPDSNRVRRAHLRVKHRSFFSELGGICSPTFRANQSFSEATVRNVFEASCPGLLAQKTVALFVTPSTHNRIFVLALLNQEVVPSWHSPTSMKSFS
jgi:hypothetical protein